MPRTPANVYCGRASATLGADHGSDSWLGLVRHVATAMKGERTAAAPACLPLPITDREVNLCLFLSDGRRAITAAERDPVRM